MSSLADLFEFLHSPNPDARQVALSNLVGHTAKGQAARSIFIPNGSTPTKAQLIADENGAQSKSLSQEELFKIGMLEDLKLLCRDQAVIAHDAFSALINLSDTVIIARHLADEPFLTFLISYTCNHTSPLSPLSAMLLSNISAHASITPMIPLLQIPILEMPPLPTSFPNAASIPPYYYPLSRSASSTVHPAFRPDMEEKPEKLPSVDAVRALVQAFEDGAGEGVDEGKEGAKRKGGVHFLASVFANISMVKQTRPTLLNPYPAFPKPVDPETFSPEDEPLLTKIVVYTEHKDTIRRGGALGCIKNAAMDRASHPFLLATEHDRVTLPSNPSRKVKGVDVLPWVLSPLMGPEEIDMDESENLPESLQFLGPDKVRERDPVLRLMCVEILMLLAASFTGREALRNRGTYTVIKLAHEAETDANISEHMIRLVGLLKRDEGAESSRDVLEVRQFGEEELTVDEEGATEADEEMEIEVL
ncbi:Protein hgh1 [Naganishia albida]|nr:Protein hgh1 [Naganishia albida]